MSTHASSILQNSQLMVSEVAVPILKKSAAQTIKSYMENLRNSFALKAIVIVTVALSLIIGFKLYARRKFSYTPIEFYEGGDLFRGHALTRGNKLFLKSDFSETDIRNIIDEHDFSVSGYGRKYVCWLWNAGEPARFVFANTIDVELKLDESEKVDDESWKCVSIPMNAKLLNASIMGLRRSAHESKDKLYKSIREKQIRLLRSIQVARS